MSRMSRNKLHNILNRSKYFCTRNNRMLASRQNYHSEAADNEDIPPQEWCEAAFSKMQKWSHSLKDVDLIGGRLVNINDHSRIFDEKMEKRMHLFKSIGRELILLPSMQATLKSNLMASSADQRCKEFEYFCRPNERDAVTLSSLTKVADILSISAQQRKVVRKTTVPQVTHHKIWISSLVEILNGLKSDVELLMVIRPSKELRLSQQIVVGGLKILESAMSYDHDSSSWMRLSPKKGTKSNPNSADSPTWGDALEICSDLVDCLSDVTELSFHIAKLELMKEGLYLIRDVLIDRSIGYKENRYQEHLVHKKLSKSLGHSSKCLFTLLMYYLYGTIADVELEVRGGVHVIGIGQKLCLYAGKILTVDEENVVLSGVKQLDAAMGVFKFVWETAGAKGDLELQGHLWCVGAKNRSFTYKGNIYMVHALHL